MTTSTRDRALDAALVSFATRGYEATSLDDVAGEVGVSKQAVLYYFTSKPVLLDAVVDRSATELSAALVAALARGGVGWVRVAGVVRTVFRLGRGRPVVLGLLREVSRLGPPAAPRLMAVLDPLVQRAREFLEVEMAAGRMRATDSRLLLMSAYSTVIGMATEVEVLRALGEEPTLRSLARRRRELLDFLRSALTAPVAA